MAFIAGASTADTTEMKDYQASLEKLRKDAAEAALIRDLATDQPKREMFDRLHQHFNRLADELERAMSDHKIAEAKVGGMQVL
jgi:hypothetical protein